MAEYVCSECGSSEPFDRGEPFGPNNDLCDTPYCHMGAAIPVEPEQEFATDDLVVCDDVSHKHFYSSSCTNPRAAHPPKPGEIVRVQSGAEVDRIMDGPPPVSPQIRNPQDVLRGLPDDAGARKQLPLVTGLLDYFPAALAEVAAVSKAGNDQHNPGQPIHWARGKSTDHADCALRHLVDRGTRDSDGLRHTAKAAWRALALLQEECEADAGFTPEEV